MFFCKDIFKYINNFIYSIKESFKSIVYKNNVFSALGFNYLGPVDGHNVEAMESIFKIAANYNRPSIVHVITTKGKGYSYAETSPKNYHGVSPFDIEEGTGNTNSTSFSDVAGDALCELAEINQNICAITAAMTSGTGLSRFAEMYKNRFFDVGIAEQHAVTFAAGLKKGGLKPYFAVYSSFLQRAYDQIIHDCAIDNLPVCFLVDRAGIVGEDGETHHGIFDISFLNSIPNMIICMGKDNAMKCMIEGESPLIVHANFFTYNPSWTECNFRLTMEYVDAASYDNPSIISASLARTYIL